jgi:hypothetical protein
VSASSFPGSRATITRRTLCTTTRFHRRLLAWLLAAAAGLGACAQSEWRELPVNDGAFSVLMRGEPHYTRQQLNTAAGKMFAHLYSSDRPDSYFAVGYADYPLALVVGGSPEQLFSGVRDTWLRRIGGTLTATDNTVKLDGKYPGIEFQARGKVNEADAFLHARLYLVDQRLYQLIAMGRKDVVSQGVINRFLNSFRLIPQSEVGTIQVGPAGN